MLISLLVFVPGKGTNALNRTLPPKFNLRVGAPSKRSRNWLAPRAQAGIRHLHLRDVSSTHLVGGLSQWSTVLRSGSESVVIFANYFFAARINELHRSARHASVTIHLAVKTGHPQISGKLKTENGKFLLSKNTVQNYCKYRSGARGKGDVLQYFWFYLLFVFKWIIFGA